MRRGMQGGAEEKMGPGTTLSFGSSVLVKLGCHSGLVPESRAAREEGVASPPPNPPPSRGRASVLVLTACLLALAGFYFMRIVVTSGPKLRDE